MLVLFYIIFPLIIYGTGMKKTALKLAITVKILNGCPSIYLPNLLNHGNAEVYPSYCWVKARVHAEQCTTLLQDQKNYTQMHS